jgi:hypothetical protein
MTDVLRRKGESKEVPAVRPGGWLHNVSMSSKRVTHLTIFFLIRSDDYVLQRIGK